MDYFELTRNFWDFAYDNPEKIKPNHCALFLFAVEHCNRLGWKDKFGLPSTMSKEAIGIKSYNTYINTLNELAEFGLIKFYEKSKNQYSCNIIGISNINKATSKALDKAFIKHDTKQIVKQSESTVQSIDSITKQYTINNIQYTIDQAFDIFWNTYNKKIDTKKVKDKFFKLSESEIQNILDSVENYVASTPDIQFRKNPLTWLNGKNWNDTLSIKPVITETIVKKKIVEDYVKPNNLNIQDQSVINKLEKFKKFCLESYNSVTNFEKHNQNIEVLLRLHKEEIYKSKIGML